MKNYLPLIIFIAVLVAIDLYAFKSLKLITASWSKTAWKQGLQITYWVTSIGAYATLIYAVLTYRESQAKMDYYFFFMGFGILMKPDLDGQLAPEFNHGAEFARELTRGAILQTIEFSEQGFQHRPIGGPKLLEMFHRIGDTRRQGTLPLAPAGL